MSGLLAPDPRLRELTDLGVIAAGALLHTYVSGTPSTPLATYNNVDCAAGHENANPVVASAGGLFGPIYLPPSVAYKFLLTDALGNELWRQDPVMVPSSTSGTLTVALGGTGLTVGISGGVLAFTATGTLASSALLVANAIMLGGGAGVVPATEANWLINAQHILNSATQPRCVAFHNATQSIPDSTVTSALLNSEDLDVGTMHDLVTNNSRLTIPTGGDGFYLVRATVAFAANATGLRRIDILKSGATVLATNRLISSGAGDLTRFEATWFGNLVAADYVEAQAWQNSGGALNISLGTRGATSELAAVKLW